MIGLAICLLTSGCKKQTVYFQYVSTTENGWDKNDTIIFQTPRMKDAGSYAEELGVRITGDYPFKSLQLVVDQRLLPAQQHRSDTIDCKLLNDMGEAIGGGVNVYQYIFALPSQQLNKGDSLRITVRHNMKREILPGINDIGFRLKRKRTEGAS